MGKRRAPKQDGWKTELFSYTLFFAVFALVMGMEIVNHFGILDSFSNSITIIEAPVEPTNSTYNQASYGDVENP